MQRKGVNPPLVRASTVIFEDSQTYIESRSERDSNPYCFTYGRHGTPTCYELCEAIRKIYNADSVRLFPTGVAAIANGMLALLSKGDHLLVVDNVFNPTRKIITYLQGKLGLSVDYFDPSVTSIENLIRENTKLLFLESPGSFTFEVLDMPKLSKMAKKYNITTICDDTYSSGLLSHPFSLGAEVVILAGTKYISGHSDVMMGAIITSSKDYSKKISDHSTVFGQTLSPDDAYLALRGLRTVEVRMEKHEKNALRLATWLSQNNHVKKVYHPALKESSEYAIWKRDFSGSNGLFSITFTNTTTDCIHSFMDRLKIFKIGGSWGGYDSLVVPAELNQRRIQENAQHTLRFHAGLEDYDELKNDIEQALRVFNSK